MLEWNFTAAWKLVSYGLVCISLNFKVPVRVSQHRTELEVIYHFLEVKFSLKILENMIAHFGYDTNTAANTAFMFSVSFLEKVFIQTFFIGSSSKTEPTLQNLLVGICWMY